MPTHLPYVFCLLRGFCQSQYVNYSNINLKAEGYLSQIVEEEISTRILKVPECGQCEHCTNEQSFKLCVQRQKVRDALLVEAEKKYAHTAWKSSSNNNDGKENKTKAGGKKRAIDSISGGDAKTGSTKKKSKSAFAGLGKAHGSGGSRLGSKPMAVPDEVIPDICQRISAYGTDKRMKIIEDFIKQYPDISNRQLQIKIAEIATRTRPDCVPEPKRREGPGRAVYYYLRPRFYHLLPVSERPAQWEKFAEIDKAEAAADGAESAVTSLSTPPKG